MTEPEPRAGDVLGGRYEILGLLGRGGMATVYRGRDLRLQRTVAVKVFRGGLAEAMDPGRIAQEMQLLAGFDHPSVVAVLDASTGDGVFGPHLVMEFVAGSDLGAMLHAARGPLSADFARRIVADVAEALQALHDKGVVHRDVKPANILVPRRSPTSVSSVAAKLTDFGIAQMVEEGRASAPESILGTAAYLSPEQVRGAEGRPASDVYSLGLVLLEALTGRRAFPGPAAASAMARLASRPPLPDDASPALAELLSRMTALDPRQRPSAGEVARLLRTELVGRVTRPEAAHTAPTPIGGIGALRQPVPAEVEADATAPHRPWPQTGAVAASTAAPPPRRRFPAALVVTASVLAAAVAGVAISAAAGVGSTVPAGTRSRPAVSSTVAPPAAADVQPLSTASTAPGPTSVRPVRSPSPSASPSATGARLQRPTAASSPVATTGSGTGTGTSTGTDAGTSTGSGAGSGAGLAAPVAPTPSASPSPTSADAAPTTAATPASTPTDGSSDGTGD